MICVKCAAEVPDLPFCGRCGWKQSEPVLRKTKRPNGAGCVFKRGKTWTAQVTLYTQALRTPEGKPVLRQKRRTKSGFATKRAALEYLETLRSPEGRRCPTLLHYYELYESGDMQKLSKDKITAYKKARQRLEDIIGCRVDALGIGDLQGVVNANASSYYTAKDMKVLLSHLWKPAMAEQYVVVDLPSFISLPELEEKETEAFTDLEVQAFWAAYSSGQEFAGYILLMIYSGMMPGELLDCRVENIDLTRCEIFGCGKKTAKRKKEAPIVFPDFLAPLVEELMSRTEGTGKLLRINKDNFYKRYYETLEAAKVRRLAPYSCRHTTGTEAARQNLAAPIIQNILRHSKITTTQKYIHLASEDTHRGVNQLSGAPKNKEEPRGVPSPDQAAS